MFGWKPSQLASYQWFWDLITRMSSKPGFFWCFEHYLQSLCHGVLHTVKSHKDRVVIVWSLLILEMSCLFPVSLFEWSTVWYSLLQESPDYNELSLSTSLFDMSWVRVHEGDVYSTQLIPSIVVLVFFSFYSGVQLFSRVEWFYYDYNRIKKDENQGQKCHTGTMMLSEADKLSKLNVHDDFITSE